MTVLTIEAAETLCMVCVNQRNIFLEKNIFG